MKESGFMSNELIEEKKDKIGIQGQDSKKSITALIDLAINLWRLEKAVSYLRLTETSPEKQRLDRHLAASKDSLLQLGIEYEDHTGDLVPDKGEYALKVIEYIPQKDITNDVVIETLKPSVYYREKMISPGEVFVGIHVRNSDSEENKIASFVNEILNSIANIWKKISRS